MVLSQRLSRNKDDKANMLNLLHFDSQSGAGKDKRQIFMKQVAR